MTYDELLAALQGFLGRRVIVSVGPGDGQAPMVGLLGVLERGEPSPAQEVLEGLGRALPGDEAIMFHLTSETRITVTRGRHREAGWIDGNSDFLYFDQGGLLLTVAAEDDAHAFAEAVQRKYG